METNNVPTFYENPSFYYVKYKIKVELPKNIYLKQPVIAPWEVSLRICLAKSENLSKH